MRLATLSTALVLLSSGLRAAPAGELVAIGNRCVIDQARLLDANQTRTLLDLCKQLDRSGVAQLGVVTVSSLGDSTLSDYAAELVKK